MQNECNIRQTCTHSRVKVLWAHKKVHPARPTATDRPLNPNVNHLNAQRKAHPATSRHIQQARDSANNVMELTSRPNSNF